jgi:predicted phage baseplate assembly protein
MTRNNIIREEICGCCEGIEEVTPQPIANRPGLDALAYRVGTHATFLETMKSCLSTLCLGSEEECQIEAGLRPLRHLTTREAGDPAIALLDAWATVADVLTFYQERLANEGYLRTATERRSILELARLVGYRLRPGVAATVYLAFILENGFNADVEIPAGTRAQSLPGPGELPQSFETAEPLKARAVWNDLKPRISKPQNIRPGSIPSNTIYFKGTQTNLKLNDPILLDFNRGDQDLYRVKEVAPDAVFDRTQVHVLPWSPIAAPVTEPGDTVGEEDCINFDYRNARVRKVGGRWKIVVGNMLLLDFGNSGSEARKALRIINHYHMNQQCFVGRPDPSMEYYLVNGQAPVGALKGEDCVGFNPGNINVKQIGGRWKIVEGNHWIMDFGHKKNEAEQAFQIIQEYGFEYICFVGRPNPSMVYFRRDSPVEEGCISFDYRRAEVKRIDDRWKIVEDDHWILDFGDSEIEAREALRIIQHYRMNKQCFVGRPDPSMEYYLVNGQAPVGALEGEDCVGFNPDNIEVKQIGGQWKIVEDNHWIMNFDDKENEARQAFQIIQKYGFEYICFVGRPHPSMTYFRRNKESGLQDLIKPLITPASLQPASRFRLPRNLATIFGMRSDIAPRLLRTLHPALKDVLYRAWRNVEPAERAELTDVVTFRVKAAPFGHNAPLEPDNDNWALDVAPDERNILALDAQYDQIVPGSLVIIERSNDPHTDKLPVYQVERMQSVSKAEFGITGRVTQLALDRDWLGDTDTQLSHIRETTVYASSESLAREGLAEKQIEEDIAGDTIELANLYGGLEAGRWIIISGERTDIPGTSGIKASELLMIAGVNQETDEALPDDKRHTALKLANKLAYTFKRDTVTIYGNVVKATHGETRQEVLGSGDASQAWQQFTLRQSPLTYVAATTPDGVASTLKVFVNGIRWREVENSVQLNQRTYLTHTDDENKTTIVFGAPLPTGVENVIAEYRNGIGKVGNVAAEQISLLATRPLGVKGVINPLRASGGADREGRDQARHNAPLPVMALDRLVSVQDYADFSRAFAGIGKSSATRLSDGQRQLVHVTIAGADDILIDENSDLYRNLRQALNEFGDPYQRIQVNVRELMLLIISAKVRLLPDYQWESVEPQIRAKLLAAFGFERRELGQDVLLSEVISAIQGVGGVAYVDVDLLEGITEAEAKDPIQLASKLKKLTKPNAELPEEEKQPKKRIVVEMTRFGNGNTIQPAQLAFLSPEIPDTLILTELI